jgi:putative acetyltransferase
MTYTPTSSTPVGCSLCRTPTPADDLLEIESRGFLCPGCVGAVQAATAAACVDVRHEALDSPLAVRLITALNAELAAEYNDPRANHFRLDQDEVAPNRGAFLVAWSGAEAVGCGAIRRLDDDSAELKRMYVVAEWRGHGIGRHVLEALEGEARRLGVRRMVLETGNRQTRALSLYRAFGFVEIPPYGEYVASPATSVCMAKEIA